jgi:hypothetical protein
MADRDQTATVDLKVRMKEPLRERIEAAARARGISMNAEAVARLEESFRDESLLPQILDFAFGCQLSGLVLLLARVARETGVRISFDGKAAPAEPLNDPHVFDQMVRAITRALEAIRPPGEIKQPKVVADLRKAGLDRLARTHENIGEGFANGVLLAVAGDPASQGWLKEVATPIRDKLGPDVVHRIAEAMGVEHKKARGARRDAR